MDIGDVLIEVANKLGMATQKVVKIYTKAQVYEAWATIIAIMFFIFVGLAYCWLSVRMVNRLLNDKNEKLFTTIMLWVFGLLAIMFLANVVRITFLRLTVPEYVAIKELLRNLAKLR